MFVLLVGANSKTYAQNDDFGVWLNAGAEKKMSKKWSLNADLGFRTRNNSKTVDRWSGELGAEYKITSFLKAAAEYELLYDNFDDKYTYHSDGSINKYTPSYWGVRHRFNVSLTGDVNVSNFNFSLREMWQYTYRPKASNKKYDTDTEEWEDVKSKSHNLLRSRFQVKYTFPKSPFQPFGSVELFNGKGGLQKTRYTLGTAYEINKHNELKLYYRYQNICGDDDDDEPDEHIIGVGYTFKF